LILCSRTAFAEYSALLALALVSMYLTPPFDPAQLVIIHSRHFDAGVNAVKQGSLLRVLRSWREKHIQHITPFVIQSTEYQILSLWFILTIQQYF